MPHNFPHVVCACSSQASSSQLSSRQTKRPCAPQSWALVFPFMQAAPLYAVDGDHRPPPYLRVWRVPPRVLRRSCALVHVSAPWRAPDGTDELPHRLSAESNWPTRLLHRSVESCLPIFFRDTRAFSANDASRVKTCFLLVRQLCVRAGCSVTRR